ncbi:MAG TPA: PEP-CTERM sorting domain-containing protein, partial [Tepidisphaeraceae bacterium]|nr:PEP-CTERM sorting domain-containing protein [Tepidisphaeraceae bacterium]
LTLNAGGSMASANYTVAATATLNANGALASTANVTANGAVNFGGTTGGTARTQALGTLAIGSGVTVSITHSAFAFTPTILKPNTTTFADSTAKIDLSDNTFITNGTAAGALGLIQAGQIFSSEIADPNKAIGYIDLSGADAGNYETRYTLKGDTNLDGAVGVGDLGALATSYGVTGGMSWANGDFNQDHNVNVADLGALATNYGTQLSTSSAVATSLAIVASGGGGGGGAAVPEPASVSLLGIGALTLASGRRRRRLAD